RGLADPRATTVAASAAETCTVLMALLRARGRAIVAHSRALSSRVTVLERRRLRSRSNRCSSGGVAGSSESPRVDLDALRFYAALRTVPVSGNSYASPCPGSFVSRVPVGDDNFVDKACPSSSACLTD